MDEPARRLMVRDQLEARGIRDARVLRAMSAISRHAFVPAPFQSQAYDDLPLPLGFGQTISQPFIVALMTSELRLTGQERVLEIGTGSGYQTAILSWLCREVYSIERLPELLDAARRQFATLSRANIRLKCGDGAQGWPEHAPYDAILVAAAAPAVPPALLEQLKPGGRMVIPLGPPDQQVLTLVEPSPTRVSSRPITGCVFVPLITPAAA